MSTGVAHGRPAIPARKSEFVTALTGTKGRIPRCCIMPASPQPEPPIPAPKPDVVRPPAPLEEPQPEKGPDLPQTGPDVVVPPAPEVITPSQPQEIPSTP